MSSPPKPFLQTGMGCTRPRLSSGAHPPWTRTRWREAIGEPLVLLQLRRNGWGCRSRATGRQDEKQKQWGAPPVAQAVIDRKPDSRGFQEQASGRLLGRIGRVFHPEWRSRGNDRGATLAGVDGDHASAGKRSIRTQPLGEKVSGEFLEIGLGHGERSIRDLACETRRRPGRRAARSRRRGWG